MSTTTCKRITLFAAIAFAFPVGGFAQESIDQISGEMSCEVTSNSVLEVKDGKPTTYNGFKDGFEVGDILTFRYALSPESEWLALDLKDEVRDQPLSFAYPNYDMIRRVNEAGTEVTYNYPFGNGYFGLERIVLVTDRLGVKTSSVLSLSRYYRSDWQGIASTLVNNTDLHTYTFDCRTVGADNIQTAFEALRSMVRARDD